MKQVIKIETPPPILIRSKEKNTIEDMFVWSKKLNRAVRVYGKGKK